MKKIVIYPGRFQPMLSHHVAVYDYLVKTFSDAEVFIGTSDKVDDKSPFNYKEKQMIALSQGIDPNKVLFAPQPYVHTFYKQFDHDNVVVIFAVGEKDMAERFAMTNVDPDTGLDMKVRPNKETGETEPKYYQMINSMKEQPLPMSQRGYLFEVPNIDTDGEVASASAFRNALKNSPDKESAKPIFDKQFKEYNEEVFNLVYDKIAGNKMSEDINILKQLAGLNVDEAAPVEFESNVEVKDIEFTPPSKSSSFHSIANRFPEGSDVNDESVKREEFINALVRSPASLLSEINERISPADDNGLAASEKLNKIIDVVQRDGKNLTDLKDDDKKFAIDLVKKAIKEMELDAGDDSEYETDDEPAQESVDLTSIKEDYGIVKLDESMIVCDIFEDASEEDFGEFLESLTEQELKILASTFLMEVGIMQKLGQMSAGKPATKNAVNVIQAPQKKKAQGQSMMTKFGDKAKSAGNLLKKVGKYVGGKAMAGAEMGAQGLKIIAQKGKEIAKMQAYKMSQEGRNAAKRKRIEDLKKSELLKANDEVLDHVKKQHDIAIKNNSNPDHAQAIYDKMAQTDPEMAGRFIAAFEMKGSIRFAYQMSTGGLDQKISGPYSQFQNQAKVSAPDNKLLNDPENIFSSLNVDEGRMSDIHQDANSMSKEEFAKEHPMFADDYEGLQHEDDPNEPSQEEIDANYSIVKKYIGKKKDESVEESSEDSGEGPISSMSDEDLMDYVGQKEEDLVDDMQQHIAPDFLHKENFEEMFEKYREEVLEPAAEEISQEMAMDQMPDEMEMDAEESIEDTSGKALEAAMEELKKLAGLNEADKKEFDEAGCMAEMKKLYASGCTKESMYSKLNAEYDCNRKQFEELYAHSCG